VRSLSLLLLLLSLLLLLREELRPRRFLSLLDPRDFLGGVRSPLSERLRRVSPFDLRGGVFSPLFERRRSLLAGGCRGGVVAVLRGGVFSPSLSARFARRGGVLLESRADVFAALGDRLFSVFTLSFSTGSCFSSYPTLLLLSFSDCAVSGCSFFDLCMSASTFTSASLAERSRLRFWDASSFKAAPSA